MEKEQKTLKWSHTSDRLVIMEENRRNNIFIITSDGDIICEYHTKEKKVYALSEVRVRLAKPKLFHEGRICLETKDGNYYMRIKKKNEYEFYTLFQILKDNDADFEVVD